MFDFTKELISQAVSMGASYAEGRVVDQSQQAVTSKNNVSNISESKTCGFGIRVLVDGHWGFASDSMAQQDSSQTVKKAITLARAMPERSRRVRLADTPPVQDSYDTPCEQDPFSVSTSEKVDLVQSITQAMSDASNKVVKSEAKLDFRREISYLVTSEGTEIRQTITRSGLVMSSMVEENGQVYQRAFPSRHGDCGSGGYELIKAFNPLDAVDKIVPEAIELIDAPACPEGITTVILDPSMLGMVLHETVGHAIELDRALGDEADNFGSSFLRPHHLGELQYGSNHVSIVADATRAGAVATYGYDHEGVKVQEIPIVEQGIFKNYLMSRETALHLDKQSNGTALATSWNRIPMVRITNLCLMPGKHTKEQLISETDDGLYLETFKGADIDDKRLTFSFAAERGWKIRNGKIVGLVKNPVMYGETPTFWRNCTGVAGIDQSRIGGIFYCGKGLPWQFISTGQGGPPARFDQVKVGSA